MIRISFGEMISALPRARRVRKTNRVYSYRGIDYKADTIRVHNIVLIKCTTRRVCVCACARTRLPSSKTNGFHEFLKVSDPFSKPLQSFQLLIPKPSTLSSRLAK